MSQISTDTLKLPANAGIDSMTAVNEAMLQTTQSNPASTTSIGPLTYTQEDGSRSTLRRRLMERAEFVITISTAHLRADTRIGLAAGTLSVLTYPYEYGGFVYVDAGDPAETELPPIFDAARNAAVAWIKFDSEAPKVDGFTIFED